MALMESHMLYYLLEKTLVAGLILNAVFHISDSRVGAILFLSELGQL